MEAPGLVIEKNRLATIGPNLFLGIVGDQNHTFGYHLVNPPPGDYSTEGSANKPVGSYACAIDVSMSWPASRTWLQWLITEIREDRIQGIAEVIGSFDGRNVRYWSDTSGWQQEGVPYEYSGHDTWTHVAVYRSTAKQDHGILAGWTATGYAPTGDDDMPQGMGPIQLPNTIKGQQSYSIWPVNLGSAGFGPAWLTIWADLFGGRAALRVAITPGDNTWKFLGVPRVPGEEPVFIVESGKTANVALPDGTRGISVTRMPVDATDDCALSVSMSIEYGRR